MHERRFIEQEFQIVEAADVRVGILATVLTLDCLKVHHLFLLPEHQGKGMGKVCMQKVMAEAQSLHLPVRLQVLKVNPRARAFYETLGFCQCGETETHTMMEWVA